MAESIGKCRPGVPGAMVKPARQLDLVLREARNRLVAHRIPSHAYIYSWALDHSLQPSLVDPDKLVNAYQLLARANATLRLPHKTVREPNYGAYADLWEWVVQFAGDLAKPARAKVRQAVHLYGYDSWPATQIVAALRALVAGIPPYVDEASREAT
jgi:hypothetical protein